MEKNLKMIMKMILIGKDGINLVEENMEEKIDVMKITIGI